MTPDVNVLLAASRSDHPHHGPAYQWLTRALEQAGHGSAFTLQPLVLASFLRLATHPRIFRHPTPIEEAVRFVDALLAAPGVTLAVLGPEWPILRRLCLDEDLSDNDIPDAWLAAAAVDQGEHVVSFDGDLKRLLPRGQFTRLNPQPDPR